MASINVSSLTSTNFGSFDWQTMVNELIQVDSQPVTTLQNQETANQSQISALNSIQNDISTLRTGVQALADPTLYSGRTATASGTGWNVSADNSTPAGLYSINIAQLASTARLQGAAQVGAPLSATSDVSGLTIATLPIATTITAGTFTVDGQQVAVASTDSLQDVFNNISTATGGAVTASYDPNTDTVSLSSGSEIVLGAVNDTSNFLPALKLANNGSGTVTSSSALGAAQLGVPIASANLKTPVTAVDGSGNGSFSINGVSISYNVNTDSLATVIGRINNAGAGVIASYNPTNDSVVLTNTATGDTGIGANEASGGLLGALGLTTGATLVHGLNAQYSVNGGPTLTSTGNTLDGSQFGATGLSVQATTAGTQTVNVATDTNSIQTAIQNFISQYNTVQNDIASQTAISIDPTTGKVTTSTLSSDHDIQNWASDLRDLVFAQVPGLSGAIKSLDAMGIDFDSTGTLSVSDSAKLSSALANNTGDVAAFFTTASTGFANAVNANLANVLGPAGTIAVFTGTLTQQDTKIEEQITTLNNQLAQERTQLTNAFEAMQAAQSTAQTQLNSLNQMFNSTSTKSSSSG
jgi:flagellar hook-associated protein 2